MWGLRELGHWSWERPQWVLVGCVTLTGIVTGLVPSGPAGAALAAAWLVGALACSLWLLAWTDRARGHALATFPLAVAAAGICVSAVAAVGVPNSLWQSAPALRVMLTLALAGFAWLLRHSLPPRGQGAPGGVVAAAAVPAVAMPLILVFAKPALLLGPAATRMATLLPGEDGAAFLSMARGLLANGHLPASTVESEYFGYPPLAAQIGVLPHRLIDPEVAVSDLVGAAVAAVATSWVACALAFSAALLALMVASLDRGPNGHSQLAGPAQWRPAQLVVLLAAASLVQLIAYSMVGALSDVQHLSLAWTGTILVVLAAMLRPVLAAAQRSWLPGAAALLTLGMAAPLAWSFGIATILLFTVVAGWTLVTAAPGRVGWALAVCLNSGAILGFGVTVLPALAGEAPDSLLAAGGATVLITWPPLALLGAATLGLAVLASGVVRDQLGTPAWAWNAQSALLLTLAGAGGALAVAGAQMLPMTTGSYARDKTAYLALMALPAVLAVVQRRLAALDPVPAMAFVLALGLAVSGQFVTGSALSWTARHTTPELVARAERIIAAADAGVGSPRVVCVPSPALTAVDSYLCQRWLDALSHDQGTARRMREVVAGENSPAALATAAQAGLLPAGSSYVDARQIWVGQATDGFTPPTDLP